MLVAAIAGAAPAAWAQGKAVGASPSPAWPATAPASGSAPLVLADQGLYAANATVGRVTVEVERSTLPADGQSATRVTVAVFDHAGHPLQASAMLTVEVSGGRIQLPGAKTDELGPGRLDADPAVPGIQIAIHKGQTQFNLLAPDRPQDVLLRVGAGAAQAEGVVSFVPDARQLVAVGLLEGVIRLSRKDPNLIQPVRLDDGFEVELRRFSRSFSDGKGQAAARAAWYIKGKIRGDALLTAAYDSEKETRARLLRDIKPNEFYPVYGDSSIKSFDAQSSSRLYVRIDKDKSYALYGDFNTADGFGAAYGAPGTAPNALRSLGAYSRTLTGVRGHWQGGGDATGPGSAAQRVSLGGFAAYDSLKQVSEEFRASGTSGPFVLRNNSALENSEKVELLVRSKDNPGFIKSQRVLLRLDDYSFEPFSGRILLNRPLGSVDAEGDPVSLRVTYEVDQGGDKFWVGGVEASALLGDKLRVGGAFIEDRNPTSPYRLGSVHLGLQLAEKTWLTTELAQSDSARYAAGGAFFSNPSGQAGEQRQDRSGRAARVALDHVGQSTAVQASVARTQGGFDNPNAPLQAGRSEAQAKGSVQVSDTVKLFGEGLYGEDSSTGGKRKGAAVGAEVKLGDSLQLQAGVRKAAESGAWNGNNAGLAAGVTPNVTPGSSTQATGGMFGGIAAVAINPGTGQSMTTFAATGVATAAGAGIQVDATTLFLGARLRASERLVVEGLIEGSLSGGDKNRAVLASSYGLSERSRLVARYEHQSGVTSAYGAARSNVLSLGADTSYMPGGQLFSEYRLRDATSREAQWANGVRNTWAVREGVTYTTAAEYLKVLDGGSAGASAAAVSLGYDNTAHALWKLGSKLEWRRVLDNGRTSADEQSDSLLSTVQVARKLSRDWTALARNYLLFNRQGQGPNGAGAYDALQNRLQFGAAYRPVDNNKLDLLTKYEYKYARNAEQQLGLTEQVHIASLHGIYHPSRPYWLSARVAVKSRSETGLSAFGKAEYGAALVAGRVVYDITEDIDFGVMAAALVGNPGRARQTALGLEMGYLVQQNLWLSAGYNWRGFNDRDLSAGDYTNSGFYLRLRFKFDEDLFAGTSRAINRVLDRLSPAGGGNVDGSTATPAVKP